MWRVAIIAIYKGTYMLCIAFHLFMVVYCTKQRKEEVSDTSHLHSQTASLAVRVPTLLIGDVSVSPWRMVKT